MDKIKELFFKTLDWFKTRRLGFWLLVPVVVLSFIVPFVYLAGFKLTNQFSGWGMALPFIAILGFVAAFFKPTEKYAPIIMYILEFVSLLVFVKTSYMYLTTAFFNGITGNILVQAGFPYSFCTIALLLNMALCIAAMFLKQGRKPNSENAEREHTPNEEVKEAAV